MASRFAVRALFLGAAAYVQAETNALWDDAVNLMQQSKIDTSPTRDNRTQELHKTLYRRNKQLSMGGTGMYCISDHADVLGRVGCMGGGISCASCVNGIITCKVGYHAVVDFYGRVNCATPGRRELCMSKGCRPGGCCEQTCCPPKMTAAAYLERRQFFNVSKYTGHLPHPKLPRPSKQQMSEAFKYVKYPKHSDAELARKNKSAASSGATPSHSQTTSASQSHAKVAQFPSPYHKTVAQKTSTVKSRANPVFPSTYHKTVAQKTSAVKSSANPFFPSTHHKTAARTTGTVKSGANPFFPTHHKTVAQKASA